MFWLHRLGVTGGQSGSFKRRLLAADNIWTGIQTFGVAGAVGKLVVAGNTSGSLTLAAPATGAGTATFFQGSDTVAGLAAGQPSRTDLQRDDADILDRYLYAGRCKTLTVSNTVTFTATDGSTLAIGGGGTLGSAAYQATGTSGATIPFLNGANTCPLPNCSPPRSMDQIRH